MSPFEFFRHLGEKHLVVVTFLYSHAEEISSDLWASQCCSYCLKPTSKLRRYLKIILARLSDNVENDLRFPK